jgi:hypothetical protein
MSSARIPAPSSGRPVEGSPRKDRGGMVMGVVKIRESAPGNERRRQPVMIVTIPYEVASIVREGGYNHFSVTWADGKVILTPLKF